MAIVALALTPTVALSGGANVIKIEPPPRQGRTPANITGARHGPDEQNMHRNKRGLTIDLKNPDGNKLFMDLVKKADVVAENFRADVKHRLGIDYESESMLCKIDFQGARYTMSHDVPKQQGNDHPVIVPMGTFESKDGLVNIAANSAKMFVNLCKVTGAEHILENPSFSHAGKRREHKAELKEEVNEATRKFTTAELVEKLTAVGVPCGPIYDIGEAFEDPKAKYLHMTKVAHHKDLGDVELIRSPINLSLFPHDTEFHHAAPDPGENRAEVLGDFGYDDREIDRLIEAGAM